MELSQKEAKMFKRKTKISQCGVDAAGKQIRMCCLGRSFDQSRGVMMVVGERKRGEKTPGREMF
jgi:hypothetical protein